MAALREKKKIQEENMDLFRAAIRKRRMEIMAPYKHGSWTPEDDAQLAKLSAEGSSFTQIGKIMGRTRGAIAGRLRRMKK